MKVLLVNPIWTTKYIPPLNLCELAGFIRENGYSDVNILDLNLEIIKIQYCDDVINESIDLIKDLNPDIVGITCNTIHFPFCIELCNSLKRQLDIPVIFGGLHASLKTDELLRLSEVDYIIRGEGEVSFLELLQALDKKADIKNIKGISYRDGEDFIHNNDRELIQDLNTLPFPAYDLLPSNAIQKSDIWLSAGRGCPFNCHFCSGTRLWKYQRRKSINRIIKEIEYFKNNFAINYINFSDDCLITKNEWSKNLLSRLTEIDIKWSCLTRLDVLDTELITRMVFAGCNLVYHGIESGSQRVRNILNKKLPSEYSNDVILNNIEEEINSGLQVYCSFMTGIPTETKQEVKDTYMLASKIKEKGAMVQYWITTPYPGTTMTDQNQDELVYLDKWKSLKQSDIFGFEQYYLYHKFIDKYKNENPDYFIFKPGYHLNDFIADYNNYRNSLIFEDFYIEGLYNYIEKINGTHTLNYFEDKLRIDNTEELLCEPGNDRIIEPYSKEKNQKMTTLTDETESVQLPFVVNNADNNLQGHTSRLVDIINENKASEFIFIKPLEKNTIQNQINHGNVIIPKNCSNCFNLFRIDSDGIIELCSGDKLIKKDYVRNRTDIFRFFMLRGLHSKKNKNNYCNFYPKENELRRYKTALNALEHSIFYLHRKNFEDCLRYINISKRLGLFLNDIDGILGICHFELRNFEEAIPFLERAHHLSTNKNTFISFLVISYFHRKQYKEAVDVANVFFEQGNIENSIIFIIGMCYEKLNEYNKALKYLTKSYSIFPNNGAISQFLASVYFNLNDYDKAIKYAQSSLESNHVAGNSHLIMAMSYDQKAEYKNAIHHYKFAQKKHPDNIKISQLLDKCCEHLEN